MIRMSGYKQLVCMVLLCVGVFSMALGQQTEGEWYTYKSKKGKVAIDFPGKYTVEESFDDVGGSYNVKLQVDNELYMLNYLIYGNYKVVRRADPLALAKESLYAFAKAMDTEVNKEFEVTYKKHQGMGAEMVMDSGLFVHYKCYVVGHTKYQMVAIVENPTASPERVKRFFDSFKSSAR